MVGKRTNKVFFADCILNHVLTCAFVYLHCLHLYRIQTFTQRLEGLLATKKHYSFIIFSEFRRTCKINYVVVGAFRG